MDTCFSSHAWNQCTERSILPLQVSKAISSLQRKLRELSPNEECMIIDRDSEASYVCAVQDTDTPDRKQAVVITVIDKKEPFVKHGTKVLYCE